MRNKIVYSVIGLVVLAFLAFQVLNRNTGKTVKKGPQQHPSSVTNKVSKVAARSSAATNEVAAPSEAGKKPGQRMAKRPRSAAPDEADSDADYEEAERVTQTLTDLLADNDMEAVLREATRLKKHPNAEVRSRVAFALNWTELGGGLSELTSMLGDPDPEVAREIQGFWKTKVAEIEDSSDKATLLDAAYTTFGDSIDTEFLGDILSEFQTVEERDAVPRLSAMLEHAKNPEHVKEFISAMDAFTQPESMSETKQEALKALKAWEQKMAAEDKEEQ